jgi:hypothetical protein
LNLCHNFILKNEFLLKLASFDWVKGEEKCFECLSRIRKISEQS